MSGFSENPTHLTAVRQAAQRVRELKNILLRVGARPAARYYANPVRVFFGNFMGGAVVGAAASLIGFAVLGLDAHRGSDSALYHVLRAAQAVIMLIHKQIQQELH